MRYRPEIDGLRAVAVVPVILFHAGFQVFGGGFVGVDIFFVISGYLIATIISEEIATGKFTLTKFYERRARRIFPLMFSVALFCIPLAWLWMFPAEFKDFSQSLVAVSTFSSNILFWLESGYFEATAELKPLLHTWSLSVEEQFYIFFPLLLLFTRSIKTYWKIAVVAVLTLISFAGAVYGSVTSPSANFYLIPTRAWELGVGALLAMAAAFSIGTPRIIREGTAVIGVVLILYSIFMLDEGTPFPSLYTLLPVLGTAFVIVGATKSTIVGRALGSSVLVGIGLISYSLYIWHQPIFAFIRLRSLYEPSFSVMVGAILFSFFLSLLTWKYVETPFRRKSIVSTRVVFCFVVLGSLLIITVGVMGHFNDGFPYANRDRVVAHGFQERMRPNYGLSKDCEGYFTLSDKCRTDEQPAVIVWGDSYAMHLVDGIRKKYPDVKLIQMTKSVCGPILDLAPVTAKFSREQAMSCLEFNRKVFSWLSNNKSVKVAVLSSSFSQYLDSANQYLTDDGVSAIDSRIVRKAFSDTLEKIKGIGITPVVIAPPPSMGQDIGQCLMKAEYFDVDKSFCDFSRAQNNRYGSSVIELLRAIESENKVVWLDRIMCDSMLCRTSVGNVLLYRDSGHLSHEGSRYIGSGFDFLSESSKTIDRKSYSPDMWSDR